LVRINKIYLNLFKILLTFKKEIENLLADEDNYEIVIPDDSELTQLNLGNTFFNIIHSSKYSDDSINITKTLYNENACKILVENITNDKYCENIFSSLLIKGLDKTIDYTKSIGEYRFACGSLFITLKTGHSTVVPPLRADALMELIAPDVIFDITRLKFLTENLHEL
jgi:hypothetical protein